MKVLFAITFALMLVHCASADETKRTEKRSADDIEKHEQQSQYDDHQQQLFIQPKEEKWSQPDESLNEEEFKHQNEWESLKLQSHANDAIHHHELQGKTHNHEECETEKEYVQHDIVHHHPSQKSHEHWVPKNEAITEEEPHHVLIQDHISSHAPLHHKVSTHIGKHVHYHADRPEVHTVETTARKPTFYSYEVIHTPKSVDTEKHQTNHQLPSPLEVHHQNSVYHNKQTVHYQPSHSLEIPNQESVYKDHVEKPSHGEQYLQYHTTHAEQDFHQAAHLMSEAKPTPHHGNHQQSYTVESPMHSKPYHHDGSVIFVQKPHHDEKLYQMDHSHRHIVDNQKFVYNANHVISLDKPVYPEKQVYHHAGFSIKHTEQKSIPKEIGYSVQQPLYADNHISHQPNHAVSHPADNVHFGNHYPHYNTPSGSHILFASSHVQRPLYTEKHQANHLISPSVDMHKPVYGGHYKNLVEKPIYQQHQYAYHNDHSVQYPLAVSTSKPVHNAFDGTHGKKHVFAENPIAYHIDHHVPHSVVVPAEKATHKDVNVFRVPKPFNVHVDKPYPVYVHHPVYMEKPVPLKVIITNDKKKNSLWR
ncbi:uncharacterized protein LOC129774082 [Toxorhynchites rutilus septentrionalis]|uniref:uncharacterized protein LOC129774082 n=1 Tax=Toxorhynchites rutilus septentrionalis TaxID=329112 RepID=UPI00247AD226|nr:uncharacterized protein LOC129774082 [Toxorhynchites rutilus septentrionalis]